MPMNDDANTVTDSRGLSIQAMKSVFDELCQEDNLSTIKEGVNAGLQFFEIICRVFHLDFGDGTTSRGGPDPLVDRMVALINSHPEQFT